MNPVLTLAVEEAPTWLQTIATVCMACLCFSMTVSVYRVIKGPTLPDRVIALDLLATFLVGSICIFVLQTHQPEVLMVGVLMAIILFLGTAAFAKYLERRAKP